MESTHWERGGPLKFSCFYASSSRLHRGDCVNMKMMIRMREARGLTLMGVSERGSQRGSESRSESESEGVPVVGKPRRGKDRCLGKERRRNHPYATKPSDRQKETRRRGEGEKRSLAGIGVRLKLERRGNGGCWLGRRCYVCFPCVDHPSGEPGLGLARRQRPRACERLLGYGKSRDAVPKPLLHNHMNIGMARDIVMMPS
ncbi:hypothetical protein GQ53DRAFT_351482 [Thozetella sp. PMI_491]|nr:hypothetical protein GQ53DRAFT_351482 [Thozetella sp. PMI_491]